MKRTILASIIGFATATVVTSTQAQGIVHLDNYTQTGNLVTYGNPFVPGYGTTGPSNGIENTAGITWTIGIYGAIGNVSVAPDPFHGFSDPSTLGAVSLLSGAPGDTTQDLTGPGDPGTFQSTADAVLPGWSTGTATFVVVAYSGSTFNNSFFRGHSAGFNLSPVGATSGTAAPNVGNVFLPGGGMPGFSVTADPEPSMFALSGLGVATLMLMRRKK